MRRLEPFVFSLVIQLLGCSNIGGNRDSAAPDACHHVNVCIALPLAEVNRALGGPFAFPVASSTDDGGAYYMDDCNYVKQGTGGLIVTRTCSTLDSASSQYDRLRGGEVGPDMARIDVTGVGERAFIDDIPNGTSDRNVAMLYSFEGQVTLIIDDNAVGADQNVDEGLAMLANLVFAH